MGSAAVPHDHIVTHCPTCKVEMSLNPDVTPQRLSCRSGHRWAITVECVRVGSKNPNVTTATFTINFTPLKPGRTLAAAREDVIKEALREVPKLRRAEWRKAGPAERASMIKDYVEQHHPLTKGA